MLFRNAMTMAFVAVFALPAATQATQVTWQITGQVSSILDTTSVGGPFAVGDVFTHVFTIDDSVPRLGGGAINTSTFAAIVSSRFEIPSRSFSIDWNDGNEVGTGNDTSASDSWELVGRFADVTPSLTSLGNGVDFIQFSLRLDAPISTFGSDPPPLAQPNPAWSLANYFFTYDDNEGRDYSVNLQIDSFQAVPTPEPGTGTLAALALAGLLCARRRQK